MGFAFEEFPDADYYRSDLRAILRYIRKVNAYIKTWDEVVEEMKAAIAQMQTFDSRITNLESETTDLQNRVDVIEPKLVQLRTSVEYIYTTLSEIDDWKQLTDAKLLILSNRIDRLRVYVDDMDKAIMADYNNKFMLYNLKLNQMKSQLMALINGLIERFAYVLEHLSSDVYNPISATRITFDDNNKDIYANLRYGGITEERFAELGLTEEQLQSINLRQKDFAFNSVYFLKDFYIHSPCTGTRMSPFQVASDILCFLCGTMTESQFAALNLTEEEFEALGLTEEQYLRYNASRGSVYVDPIGGGLTESQYQHLQSDI